MIIADWGVEGNVRGTQMSITVMSNLRFMSQSSVVKNNFRERMALLSHVQANVLTLVQIRLSLIAACDGLTH